MPALALLLATLLGAAPLALARPLGLRHLVTHVGRQLRSVEEARAGARVLELLRARRAALVHRLPRALVGPVALLQAALAGGRGALLPGPERALQGTHKRVRAGGRAGRRWGGGGSKGWLYAQRELRGNHRSQMRRGTLHCVKRCAGCLAPERRRAWPPHRLRYGPWDCPTAHTCPTTIPDWTQGAAAHRVPVAALHSVGTAAKETHGGDGFGMLDYESKRMK